VGNATGKDNEGACGRRRRKSCTGSRFGPTSRCVAVNDRIDDNGRSTDAARTSGTGFQQRVVLYACLIQAVTRFRSPMRRILEVVLSNAGDRRLRRRQASMSAQRSAGAFCLVPRLIVSIRAGTLDAACAATQAKAHMPGCAVPAFSRQARSQTSARRRGTHDSDHRLPNHPRRNDVRRPRQHLFRERDRRATLRRSVQRLERSACVDLLRTGRVGGKWPSNPRDTHRLLMRQARVSRVEREQWAPRRVCHCSHGRPRSSGADWPYCPAISDVFE
jgi:hypothetical protein